MVILCSKTYYRRDNEGHDISLTSSCSRTTGTYPRFPTWTSRCTLVVWRYEAATCWTWSAKSCASLVPSCWSTDRLARLLALPSSPSGELVRNRWHWSEIYSGSTTAAPLHPYNDEDEDKDDVDGMEDSCEQLAANDDDDNNEMGRMRPRPDRMGQWHWRAPVMKTTMTVARKGRTQYDYKAESPSHGQAWVSALHVRPSGKPWLLRKVVRCTTRCAIASPDGRPLCPGRENSCSATLWTAALAERPTMAPGIFSVA